ncbi:MAG: hypothetical protein ACOX8R_10570, partial [Bacillota bacterium]
MKKTEAKEDVITPVNEMLRREKAARNDAGEKIYSREADSREKYFIRRKRMKPDLLKKNQSLWLFLVLVFCFFAFSGGASAEMLRAIPGVEGGSASLTVSGVTLAADGDTTYTVSIKVPADISPRFYANTGFDGENGDTCGTQLKAKAGAKQDGYRMYTVTVLNNVSRVSFRGTVGGVSVGGMTVMTKDDEGTPVDDVIVLRQVNLIADFGGADDPVSADEFCFGVIDPEGNYAVGGENGVTENGQCFNRFFLVADQSGYTFQNKAVGSRSTVDFGENALEDQEVSGDDAVALEVLTPPKYKVLYTFTVPSDANFRVHEKQGTRDEYSAVPKDLTPLSVTDNGDGTTTYQFSKGNNYFVNYEVTGEDYVSYKGTTGLESCNITIPKRYLQPRGKTARTLDRDVSHISGLNVCDLYMNVNAPGYLRLEEDGSYQLIPVRNWMGINQTWGLGAYALIQPDFHYTVVDLDGSLSADIIDIDQKGMITAKGNGTAIVLVSYDAMTVNYDPSLVGKGVGECNPNGFWGAIWPENTGVFVVSVGEEDSGIDTGMYINKEFNPANATKFAGDYIDSEMDPIYFLGDEGEYTFTPQTEGVTVSVANPTVTEEAMTFSGFEPLEAAENGSFTVPLKEGRNIVKLEKDGKAAYQVITAKSVSVTVNDMPLDEAVVAPGENIVLKFDRLYSPANRSPYYNSACGAVYHHLSGFDENYAIGQPAGPYGAYGYVSSGQTISGFVSWGTDDSGWNNPQITRTKAFSLPYDYTEDTLEISGGTFAIVGFGSPLGSHRNNYDATDSEGMAPGIMAFMGRLPDLSIKVQRELSDDEIAANAVRDQIAALPAAADITPADEEAITAARDAFDALTEEQKALVPNENILKEAEDALQAAKDAAEREKADEEAVKAVEALIDALPAAADLTLEDEAAVAAARDAYMDLRDDLWDRVTNENILLAAENKIAELQGQDAAVIKAAEDAIAAIGEVTLESEDTIAAARSAFENLTTVQQGKVKNADALTAAEAELARLKALEAADAITVRISFADEGEIVTAKDGTFLYNVELKVKDLNGDGKYSLKEAFTLFHAKYCEAGEAGYSDSGDSGWVFRFWNESAGNLCYTVEHQWVFGTMHELKDGYHVYAYNQKDGIAYTDLYAYFEEYHYAAVAENETRFTVEGLNILNSGEGRAAKAAPAGATVSVYNDKDRKIALAKVGEDGTFKVTFPEKGEYLMEVKGVSTYTLGSNVYYDATVTPARAAVTVSENTAAEKERADKAAAKKAEGAIAAIGEVTLDSETAVKTARDIFDKLTDDQKQYVPNEDVLKAAEAKLTELKQAAAEAKAKAEADARAAKAVEDRIKALKDEPTLDDERAVRAARAAYDKLTEDQKALVPNAAKLTAAEAKIAALKEQAAEKAADAAAAQAVTDAIAALPAEITTEDADAIAAARAAYDKLTENQKALVPNTETLKAAEAALEAAIAAADQEARDRAEAAKVKAAIAALPAVADISVDDAETVAAARAAYDALTDAQKALVPNAETLKAAEAALEAAIAAADQETRDKAEAAKVKAAIDMLPAVADITVDDAETVAAARAAYDKLTDDQKVLVPNEDQLIAAEKAVADAKKAAEDKAAKDAADKAAADAVKARIAALPAEVT